MRGRNPFTNGSLLRQGISLSSSQKKLKKSSLLDYLEGLLEILSDLSCSNCLVFASLNTTTFTCRLQWILGLAAELQNLRMSHINNITTMKLRVHMEAP